MSNAPMLTAGLDASLPGARQGELAVLIEEKLRFHRRPVVPGGADETPYPWSPILWTCCICT